MFFIYKQPTFIPKKQNVPKFHTFMSTENQAPAPMVANPDQLRIRELEEALYIVKIALEAGQKRGNLKFITSLVDYITVLIK